MKKNKKPKTPKVKTYLVDKPEGYKIFDGEPRKIGFWKGLGATVFGASISALYWVQVLSSTTNRYSILVS